jgi:glycerol-3-phosphate cytidylyltransferase-like family protein
LSYTHRRALLESCRYVDQVVVHSGEPKSIAWKKLRFNILLTSDEYFQSDEFLAFERECPDIPVVYIPKVEHALGSTTAISAQLVHRLQSTTEILCMGITGPIQRQVSYAIT